MGTQKKTSVPVAYADEINAVDRRAVALIELCRACSDPERLDPFVVEQVGNLFFDLLERRHAIEHYFLGTDLDSRMASDARVNAEVLYLSETHPESALEGAEQ